MVCVSYLTALLGKISGVGKMMAVTDCHQFRITDSMTGRKEVSSNVRRLKLDALSPSQWVVKSTFFLLN